MLLCPSLEQVRKRTFISPYYVRMAWDRSSLGIGKRGWGLEAPESRVLPFFIECTHRWGDELHPDYARLWVRE